MTRIVGQAGRAPVGVGTAVGLVAYSVATNRREQHQGWYVLRNAVTGVGLVAAARRRGLTWDDLGLAPGGTARGLRVGRVVSSVVAGAVIAGTAVAGRHRTGRRLLADRRAGLRPRELAWQALVRIPIGTAAFEEVAFRGVLFGLIAARHGPRVGLLTSSGVFGLWHIGPTLAALRINEVTSGRVRACVSAVALTTTAGLVLGRLRIAGGHLATPWLAHWTNNAITLVAAAMWQRAAGRAVRDPQVVDPPPRL
ncbi:CPBP family intramembrane metalloprotease [soil metagenome]